MKAGDMVRHTQKWPGISGNRVGLVVDITEKKCWRTNAQGKKINWDIIEPELHAVVLYPHNDGTIDIPVIELEVVYESR